MATLDAHPLGLYDACRLHRRGKSTDRRSLRQGDEETRPMLNGTTALSLALLALVASLADGFLR